MGILGHRIAAAVVLTMAAASPASAGLMGAAVTSQYYAYGKTSGAASHFVVDGQAHARTFNTFDVIVTDSQVIYDFRLAGTWSASTTSLSRDGLSIRSGNLLTFAGAPGISGVTIDAATNMAGLSASNISFNGSEIAIDWMGRSYSANTLVVLNVATISPAAVPEPSSLALGLGAVGLAGAAAGRRRRGVEKA